MATRRTLASAAALALAAMPAFALAAATNIVEIAQDIHNNVYNAAIGMLIGAALAYFLWGVVKYIRRAGEGDVAEGISMMSYGLLVLFVMVGVWGLVSILVEALGFTKSGSFGLR